MLLFSFLMELVFVKKNCKYTSGDSPKAYAFGVSILWTPKVVTFIFKVEVFKALNDFYSRNILARTILQNHV